MRKSTVLDNGVRIITEALPSVRSVSLGIWVNAGSRHDNQSGIAHFTEHMMFKGTASRSALEISKEIDVLGGVLNASTSKEYTVYYVKFLDEHFTRASDVLFDLFLNSVFDAAEIEKEKQVVLQEIHMTEDNPEDYISDLFAEAIFGGTDLGRPILGIHDTVNGISRDTVLDFIGTSYDPASIIIVGVGSIQHEQLVDAAAARFSGIAKGLRDKTPATLVQGGRQVFHYKDLGQVQVCLGTAGPAMTDDARWTYLVLNSLLGSSMSSMLFQEVREKLGMVYSIYSYLNAYRDCGIMAVYAGTTEENVARTLDVTVRQLKRMQAGDFGDLSLDDVKQQIKGNLLLARESTENRMVSNAKNEIYYNREVPVDEIIGKINAVTAEMVVEIAREIFVPDRMTLVTLGRLKEGDVDLAAFF